jgi:hypothetical protein
MKLPTDISLCHHPPESLDSQSRPVSSDVWLQYGYPFHPAQMPTGNVLLAVNSSQNHIHLSRSSVTLTLKILELYTKSVL